MPRPPGLPATGTRLGRYTLLEELGAGGMAVVYRAEDETLRREVAVKVLLPGGARRAERAARFLREGRAAAALDHPGILRVLDVGGGDAGGDEPAYLVMELVRGGSLADFLERAGTPVAEAAALLALPVAEALGAAPRAGVVHRDRKSVV
jgi:eukaryotic-like serine/threonine-protein kinase